MSAQSDSSHTAQVFDLKGLLDASCRKRVVALRKVTLPGQQDSAKLLSIRQSLVYQASIGPDNIEQIRNQCSQNLATAVMKQVRGILNAEFGQLRVHRYRQVFTVGHHSLDGLIGGLLRVQFYARQIELPATDGTSDPRQMSLSWGVGESVLQAENERQRRQRQKR